MKKSGNAHPFSPAAQLMAIEVISELLVSSSPHRLGEVLTEHLRELTGARTVMALVRRAEAVTCELLDVSPARRAALFSPAELGNFFYDKTPDELPFLPEALPVDHPLQAQLLRAGVRSMARYPLRVGGELIGLLLLFDMPGLERFAETDQIINLLAPPIALALKNAIAFRLIEQQALLLEQRVAERTAELRAGEERHRTILQTAMDGFWHVDTRGRLLEVNETYCRMSGYSAQELSAMSISDLEVCETADETAAHIQEVMRAGEARFETRHRRADGSVFDVEVSVQYRPVEGGRLVAFLRDITARKRAEQEQVKLEAQLLQAQKLESVGRLAGGVAHDFNNMLSVIIGHANLALMDLGPTEPPRVPLEEILKAAERSADLTRQLLAFARKQTVAPRVLDLNETVAGMLSMLQRLIGEGISLKWRPEAALWPVRIDPSQIDQILANLCVNARDAIADVGNICIETGNSVLDEGYCAQHAGFTPGEYVRIAVSDDGCGMDRETLANIFEPFFTTKGVGEGTGLGLATVYGVVQQNNGGINVYSEQGLGTTFTIYLPRHAGRVARGVTGGGQPAPRGRETILLVEDEPAILNITNLMLLRQGYTVLAADSPGEAIRLAREHAGDISLLITDVIMPEMNGRDLARNLLSLYPQLKRLFMSGYTAEVIAHHGVLDEGVHFIQKPFAMPALADRVREVLDGG